LIEVMGLAVLPGRLEDEIQLITQILTGELLDFHIIEDTHHLLHKHRYWINQLIAQYGTAVSKEFAQSVLREEVGKKFLQVLSDAGVFKNNAAGAAAFRSFMHHFTKE
jgi:UDPglucose--hexose-1-phosphate uridylyltransferase